MVSGRYFRDLEAEYIAAALSDETSGRGAPPAPNGPGPQTQSVWADYAVSEISPPVYAIGEREDVIIDDELLNGYLMDDPFSAPLEPEFQVGVITAVIETIGHAPSQNEVIDALSEAFVT